jgi:hypothetical protein
MSQIFKKKIKLSILYNFLEEFCEKKDTYYIFENITFKKAQYNNKIVPFINLIKPYYFKSKYNYLERKMNYKNFTTLIRQICKNNLIPFTSKIFYFNSTYEIKYYIYPKQV